MIDPTVGVETLRTAIVIPLDERAPELATLHAELAPGLRAHGIPLHVTVLFPFASAATVDGALPRLRGVLAGHRPFPIALVSVATWPGVVYADVGESPGLVDLLRDVFAAFPEHPPYEGAHPDPHPHATLAVTVEGGEDGTADQARSALADTLPLHVLVDEVEVIAEREAGRWQRHALLPLGVAA